nr:tight junction protein ZO-2-like isoform X5 [Lepeophtheirus salmonis]
MCTIDKSLYPFRMSLLNRSDNYRTYGQIRKCNSSLDYDRQRRAASIYSTPESQSIRSCHSRESSVVSLSRKYRDMDLNLPSQYSTAVRSASSTPYSFLPPPPTINSEEEALISEHHARSAPLRMDSSRSASTNPSSYYGAGDELLEEPVEEQGGERIVWEYHQVILSRVPGYGFGIAVSGGRDNPHFTNGDASIAISDVLKSGPAEGKLLINDRVISANNISLENVDYATAVQVLRDSGQTVHLVVKRRVVLPPNTSSNESHSLRVSLSRRGKKEDFGVILGCRIYVKEIISGSSADKDGTLKEGDFVHKINSTPLDGLSLKEARKLVESTKDKLDLILKRGDPFTSTQKKNIANLTNGGYSVKGDFYNNTNHQIPEAEPPKNSYPAQNLYVQPPSRSTVYQQHDEKNNLLRASQETHHFSNGSGLPPRPPPTDDESTDSSNLVYSSSSPLIHETPVSSVYYNTRTRNINHISTRNDSNAHYYHFKRPAVEYGTTLHRRNEEDKTALSERPSNTNINNNNNPNATNNNNTGTNANNLPYPRYISFQKAGSVGIRLTGGNDVGIFVTAVQPGSPASQKGLQPGDKILKVNDMDMKGVTREEAVLFLLSLQDTIDLIAQYRKEEYDSIVSLQRGDSFYIKAHFSYEIPEKNEMSFRKSDVFHVVDTLHNGVVGAWQVFKMDPFMSGLSRSSSSDQQVIKGVIPNKGRAEEIATQQFNAAKKEQNQSEQAKGNGGGSFFRRKREKSHRRSKSLGKRIKDTLWSTRESPAAPLEVPNVYPVMRYSRGFSADRILQRKSRKCLSDINVLSRIITDHWEDLVWSESMSKFPAYERVSLRHPGFPRPVVIFGPVADLARERLLRDYPSKFACPQDSSDDVSKNKSGIVRLSGIREIMDRRKHALLDVTPNAVDKLNYAQFYPIVIFVRADSKQTIKDCRTGVPKKAHLSSKKLFEQCQKLEKLWGHVFTGTLNLSNDNWYTKLTDLIDKQQTAPIWMSETKPDESFSDDFLFPMTSRLSYTSSPESDGEFCGDPETPKVNRAVPEVPHDGEDGRLTRSNSDSNLVSSSSNKESSDHHPLMGPINSANSNSNASANTNTNGGIPNYNAPINCAVDSPVKSGNGNIKQQHEMNSNTATKRDLYGGFRRSQVNESIDDLPLPPHPNHSSSSTSSSSPQNPSNANVKHGMSNMGGPELPPKIDRLKKPSRRTTEDSSSLDRNAHVRDMKMSAYDHNGGTIYDTYKSLDNEMMTQKSTSSLQIPHESSRHTRAVSQDPNATYRRQYSNGYDVAPKYNGNSQQQPPLSSSNKSNGYDSKYRYADYKPVPPPKTASYKPIPPPKPKSYPRTQSQPPSIEGNYMNSGPYSNNYTNNRQSTGYDDGDSNNTGFDSGHGSSLDRDYYGTTATNGNGVNTNNNHINSGGLSSSNNNNNNANANNANNNGSMGMMNGLSRQHQYYYNIPNSSGNTNGNNSGSSPKRNGGDGLDLSNREYRGSAFELYKKPLSSCPPPPSTSQAANYFNGHTTIGR